MKIFENKSVFKKLIIVLLTVIILSFVMPNIVRAEDGGIGGKLLNPVMSMFVSLGDGAMTLLQKVVFGIDNSLINVDTSASWISDIIVIITAIAIAAVAIGAVVLTGGGAVAIAIGVAKVVITVGAVATITFPISTSVVEGMLPESFYLPLYSVTPQEIFSNKIPLLDVDFFNPSESTFVDNTETVTIPESTVEQKLINYVEEKFEEEYGYNSDNVEKITSSGIEYQKWEHNGKTYQYWKEPTAGWVCRRWNLSDTSGNSIEYWNIENPASDGYGANITWGENPHYIVGNEVVNVKIDEHTETYGGISEIKSSSKELQATISNWYTILRNISLVALLSILVYTGIRIVISSTANDKSKYKQMLVDWVIAICLLFVMHYIMAFANMIVKEIINLVDSTTELSQNSNIEVIEPEVFIITDQEKVAQAYKTIVGDKGEESPYYSYFLNNSGQPAGESSTQLIWPAENFMQQARIKLQLLQDDQETYVAIGWKLIFVVLVVFTFIFMFTYLKRVVYMAFLTLIAPLVALTYPIDKMTDGKAQAFNSWFKEYIFNLLIQPMHLILYTVLVSSAMSFASQNILYVVVALGFMVPAEKLLRKFFGFSKAETPGLLGGAAGAALMMSGMSKMLGKGQKGGSKGSTGKNEKLADNNHEEKPPRMGQNFSKENAMIDAFEDSNEIENNNSNQGQDIVFADNGEDRDYADSNNNTGFSNESQDENIDYADSNNITEDGNVNYTDLNDDTKYENIDINDSNEQFDNETRDNEDSNNDGEDLNNSRRINALKAVGSYYGKKVFTPENGINLVKGAGKIALRGTGAALGATAGAIAGVTSGDVGKFAQYTATGAVGGYSAAKGIKGINTNIDRELIEQTERAYYGSEEEHQKAKAEQYKKKFVNNSKNIDTLSKIFGNERAKKLMANEVKECLDNGVTDINSIATCIRLKDDNKVKSIKEASAVAKYASRIGQDTTKMNKKNRDEWRKTFTSEFGKNSRVANNKNLKADDMADDLLKKLDAFNKIKY